MSERESLNVEIRRLWPSDMEAFRDHLLHLDARSRHERFGGGMSDDFLLHYAEHCFGQGDLLFGAFLDGHLCGAAELRSNQAIWCEQAPFERHIHGEAAFSVETEHRRRGIGEKLFRRIQRAATNHGVETIEIFVCLPDNIGMRMLAQKFKTHFTFEENALTGRLRARRPTAFSLMREALGDILDFGAALFDAQWRAFHDATRAKTAASCAPTRTQAPPRACGRRLTPPALPISILS
jgi:GNAT superfamily N-acetyltransferase